MADTGAKYPGTAASEAVSPEDDGAWYLPARIKTDDGLRSSTSNETGIHPERLKATNFGFSLPAGATVDGIKVEIERMEEETSKNVVDYLVQLLDASGALVGNNKADTVNEWPTSYAIKTYGGATDTWGASPTKAMVEDADFGVVLSTTLVANGWEAEVDFIRMTVYYTAGAKARSFAVIMG